MIIELGLTQTYRYGNKKFRKMRRRSTVHRKAVTIQMPAKSNPHSGCRFQGLQLDI